MSHTLHSSVNPEISDRYRPKKDMSSVLSIVDTPPHVRIDLVIITVKEPELLAIFELLEPLPHQSHIIGYLFEHSMYYFGRYGHYNVALLASHTAGLEPALHSLGDAIRQWRPQLIINVGIAWGADPTKQKLGDVLVADRVVNVDDLRYERSQIIESGPMPEIDARSRTIVNTCKLLWNFSNLEDQRCGVHIGLYLGSNTLLNNPEAKREFLQRHPRAVGGEMESYAVYAAAARSKIPWMVVKGISDWGDGTKSPSKEYHSVAAASAASFVHKICTTFSNLVETPRDASDEKKKVDNGNFLGKISNNLMPVVTHFKPKKLDDLKARILILKNTNPQTTVCAITGIAGCGKSELAKAYGWEHSNSSETFRWRLDSEPDETQDTASKKSYFQAYSRLVENFGFTFRKEFDSETPELLHQRLISAVWKKISQYSSWIVIFDDAASYADIERYLPLEPQIKGQILVTTRSPLFFTGNEDANFSINDGLDPAEAVQLLKETSHRHNENSTIIADLAQKLDYSPLGIRIAGSYIRMTSTGLADYSEMLERDPQERILQMMSPGFISQAVGDPKRNNTLQRAIQLSVFKVMEQNPLLFAILESCAFLAHEHISFELLLKLFQKSTEDSQLGKEWLITLIIGRDNYSLLTYHSASQRCHLHRTTQIVLKSLSTSPIEVMKKIAYALYELYPSDPYSNETFKSCQELKPHFLSLNRHIISDPVIAKSLIIERSAIQLMLGQLAFKSNQDSLALEYLQEAWNLTQYSPGATPTLQIQILRCVAGIKSNSGSHKQARQYLDLALATAKEITAKIDKLPDSSGTQIDGLSSNIHLQIAQIHNDLGDISRDNGVLGSAILSFQRSIEVCVNAKSTSKYIELQIAYSHLGIGDCLRDEQFLRKTYEAPDLVYPIYCYRRALDIFLKNSGEYHASVAMTYLRLGLLGFITDYEQFIDRGIDYPASRIYIEKALAINISVYGLTSHEVADSYFQMSNILYLSEKKEDWELSLQYQDKSIDLWILNEMPLKSIVPCYRRGRILQKLNLSLKASKAYQGVLDLAQKYPDQMIWGLRSQQRLHEIQST